MTREQWKTYFRKAREESPRRGIARANVWCLDPMTSRQGFAVKSFYRFLTMMQETRAIQRNSNKAFLPNHKRYMRALLTMARDDLNWTVRLRLPA